MVTVKKDKKESNTNCHHHVSKREDNNRQWKGMIQKTLCSVKEAQNQACIYINSKGWINLLWEEKIGDCLGQRMQRTEWAGNSKRFCLWYDSGLTGPTFLARFPYPLDEKSHSQEAPQTLINILYELSRYI